jgi:methionyl-tRNA formyltransferase
MRLVFCGTPQFAVPSLERLVSAGHQVQLVVTQPDRPHGRGMVVSAPPVKQTALRLGLPFTQPDKIKNNEPFQARLTSIQPDAIIVVGYGRIIPDWMLHLPPYGNINVHASLLPKYRGAAPIQWAIASGEVVTGVTTMKIDQELDTGDILLKRQMTIAPDDTAVSIAPRLAELGAELLVETLEELKQGILEPVPQDDSRATLAPILKKEDGLLNFNRTAAEIHNRQRGLQPWPGAYTHFRGKGLKFVAARVAECPSQHPVGEVWARGDKLFVSCGAGTCLELVELQPEGKKAISAREFINGYRPQPGERLG